MSEINPKDIDKAIEKNFPRKRDDCSGFVREVSKSLNISIPGVNLQADGMVLEMIKKAKIEMLKTYPSMLECTGPQKMKNAAKNAKSGHLVIAGMTMAELNAALKKYNITRKQGEYKNGHLAIVTGINKPGTRPIGSWGTLGGSGCRQGKLSNSFPWRAVAAGDVHYFVFFRKKVKLVA